MPGSPRDAVVHVHVGWRHKVLQIVGARPRHRIRRGIASVVLGLDGLTRFVQHHLQPTKVTHRRTEENLRREMPRVVLEELVRPRPVGVPILVCDPS